MGKPGVGGGGEQAGKGLRLQERSSICVLQEVKGTLGPVPAGYC